MALNQKFLGKRIQQKRTELNMSQMKFAELIDTSPTFVSRMERGEKGPSLETLILIAEVLNISIDALLTESMQQPYKGNHSKLLDTLEDCSSYEYFVLLHCMEALKQILREGKTIKSHVQ